MFDWPDAALAFALSGMPGVVFVDAGGVRLDRLATMVRAFEPGREVIVLPAWDASPYDRTPASAAVVGQRVAGLARLAEGAREALVLTSVRAALQRVPAPPHWASALLTIRLGDRLDEDEVRAALAAFGYRFDERVDQVGEVAIRGHVIDVFPGAAAAPVRVELSDGTVRALHRFDAASQRSVEAVEAVSLRPVVEAPPAPEQVRAEAERMANPDAAETERRDAADAGDAAEAVMLASELRSSVFAYLTGFKALVHPDALERAGEIEAEMVDAHAGARIAARSAGRALPKPEAFYVSAREVGDGLGALAVQAPALGAVEVLPGARDVKALLAQVGAAREGNGPGRVLVAGGAGLAQVLERRGVTVPCVAFEASEGFRQEGLTLLAGPPALPAGNDGVVPSSVGGMPVEEPPRLGDVVVHEEHGVCRLSGLRMVGAEERLALEFHEGTELLVPVGELSQVWRYGSEAGGVTLDRLHGAAWHKRRAEIEAEIGETAARLAEAAAARDATPAPVIKPPARPFARVVERFAYVPSADQAAAIDAVLADLAAGRPMDRLVCGDVGFGKTEVALRAAAAVALAGWQVAIVAPTTVLARQHLATFQRRLAGTGVRVEPMMRGAAAATDVRAGLADGSIGVVVGTQAIASDGVTFARLGLVVVDEEQRFGDAAKRKLAGLKSAGGGVHVLVMTATPIPRTLQAAMVGLRDVSVIATAPMRRQPTRTFVLPWGEAIVREALLREHAQGGQSFVVAPRIEDLDGLAGELRAWAPGLSVAVAHGRLKPAALEELVAGFAEGETDVLLATNIIEAGLDIPRANTILITGPHRFGLSQLHQMRGRVGRGTRRGLAYLLTAPGVRIAASTVRRLKTLETLEGLGAGVSIAAADMDARGAGDLFGDAQAGHVRAIGTELYQNLLARALGRDVACAWPVLNLELEGCIPEDYVPESNVRLALYRRMARVRTADEVAGLAEELADRFGAVPAPVALLLDAARLRAWCMATGVVRVEAGPKATALTLADAAAAVAAAERLRGEAKGERVILGMVGGAQPAARLVALLEMVAGVEAAAD